MLGTPRRSAGGCQLLIRYDCEGEKFMAINVYFVRHGQTYLNLYHRMQGWSDSPLTEKGLADAAGPVKP